jgi:putative ABC transport system substrate-binding protein
MRRRTFVAAAATAALARPGRTQVRDRIRRIGILETVPPESNATNLEALRRGLRERGYVEGQNILVEYRSANGRVDPT